MKNIKTITLLFLLLSAQALLPNYFFNQVVLGILVGGGTTVSCSNQRGAAGKTFAITTSYIALKFFYDVLTSGSGGEALKAFVSVPLNCGVVYGTAFVTHHAMR